MDAKSRVVKKKSKFLKKRKASSNVTFCVKKERHAAYKKVSSILQKPLDERSGDEIEILTKYKDVTKLVSSRIAQRQRLKDRAQEFDDAPHILSEKCKILAEALSNSNHLVVYTGAGISTAACIPDYRGSNGIWTLLQQGKDIGLHDLSRAEPTLTHMALYCLYRTGLLKHIVSQNCDGLHLRSGLPRSILSEVHGNMYIEVCIKCKPLRHYLRSFDVTEHTARFNHETLRLCYLCGAPLKDTIVHFGERGKLQWPLNWETACKQADMADVILCLGSSLKVLKRYPWLWCMDKGVKKRPKLYIVNLQWTPKDVHSTLKINGKCDMVIEQVMFHLGLSIPKYIRNLDPIFYHATALHDLETHTTSQPFLKSNENHSLNDESLFNNVDQQSSIPNINNEYNGNSINNCNSNKSSSRSSSRSSISSCSCSCSDNCSCSCSCSSSSSVSSNAFNNTLLCSSDPLNFSTSNSSCDIHANDLIKYKINPRNKINKENCYMETNSTAHQKPTLETVIKSESVGKDFSINLKQNAKVECKTEESCDKSILIEPKNLRSRKKRQQNEEPQKQKKSPSKIPVILLDRIKTENDILEQTCKPELDFTENNLAPVTRTIRSHSRQSTGKAEKSKEETNNSNLYGVLTTEGRNDLSMFNSSSVEHISATNMMLANTYFREMLMTFHPSLVLTNPYIQYMHQYFNHASTYPWNPLFDSSFYLSNVNSFPIFNPFLPVQNPFQKPFLVSEIREQTSRISSIVERASSDQSEYKEEEVEIKTDEPKCSFCSDYYNSHLCMFYVRHDSEHLNASQVCLCCEDDEEENEEAAGDDEGDRNASDDTEKSPAKVTMNPGWFGKGYKKRPVRKRK